MNSDRVKSEKWAWSFLHVVSRVFFFATSGVGEVARNKAQIVQMWLLCMCGVANEVLG